MNKRKPYDSPSLNCLQLFDESADVLMTSGVSGGDPYNLTGYDDGDFI